jgi:hypothetical protein
MVYLGKGRILSRVDDSVQHRIGQPPGQLKAAEIILGEGEEEILVLNAIRLLTRFTEVPLTIRGH